MLKLNLTGEKKVEEKYKDYYQQFIDAWGVDSQVDLCIEEMSELMKELLKHRRVKQRKFVDHEVLDERKKKIQEEIADVLNTVEQMACIFGEEEVIKIREEKINRTLKKLAEGNR